ncbi:MAG: hypothetical protein WAV89_14645 [Ignavibacteriaceae bacterium]
MFKRTVKIYFLFILSAFTIFGNGKTKLSSEEELLLQYKNEIIKAANIVGVSPRIVASIIYTEHKLNIKFGENVLDYVFAKSGYNSSMGVAQVKINTASWIEEQTHNSNSQFYLGKKIELLLTPSKDWGEIVEKLDKPESNILYAACYIAMINKLWEPYFNLLDSGNIEAGIIATIYTLGIFDSSNKIRQPHTNAQMNEFGKTAQEFYDSFSLRGEFN